MGLLDLEVFTEAGFTLIEKPKVDYTDEAMARSYLQWGFKPPAQQEAEALFAMRVMGLGPGGSVLDIGCGNGVTSVKLAEEGFPVTAARYFPGVHRGRSRTGGRARGFRGHVALHGFLHLDSGQA